MPALPQIGVHVIIMLQRPNIRISLYGAFAMMGSKKFPGRGKRRNETMLQNIAAIFSELFIANAIGSNPTCYKSIVTLRMVTQKFSEKFDK